MWSVCYSPILLVELQNGTAILLQLLIMLNKLLYHTAILPLSINPREGKTYTCIKICTQTSLGVQWLKLHPSTQGAQVLSLVRELRSHMLYSTATNKQKVCTQMLVVALFTITKNWKQPTCPGFTKQDISMQRNTVGNKKKQTVDSHNLDESQKHSSLKRLCTI